MKNLAAFILLLASVLPALAAGWQEYRDPQMGFAASFPGTPLITDIDYTTTDGTSVKAKLYALSQGTSEYRMIVADFSGSRLSDSSAFAEGLRTLLASGKVTVDITARVNQNYGRQLGITTADGSRSVAAIFFVNHKLYQIEGITHPGEDANSSYAVRFQQSLNFIGGFGGRGGRGAGR